MALANELASFKIMVEKWDQTRARLAAGSKGKHGGAKGYTTARAGSSNTRAAAQDAASRARSRIRLRAYQLPLKRLFSRH
jgi:hypothetical protein